MEEQISNTENENIEKHNVEENNNCNCECAKPNKCEIFYRALSLISFLGVVLLLILHFTKGTSSENKTTPFNADGTAYSIAYVNSDSLMNQYYLFDIYKTQLENRKKQMEDEMASKAKKFETDVTDFQKKVQSYTITSDQAQKMEADLMKRQQQLMDLKENMTNELLEMEYDNQVALFDSIIGALKIFNESHNFDYILGYSKGSGILLANDKYDITLQIVEILNKNQK